MCSSPARVTCMLPMEGLGTLRMPTVTLLIMWAHEHHITAWLIKSCLCQLCCIVPC